MTNNEALPSEMVHEFVAQAHGGLERVTELLDSNPTLINAAWDWGGGDWETALGAASHMGRRDIALFLLQRGARMDIFAAAMIGHVEIIRGMFEAFPAMRSLKGPHGISLIEHAKVGGNEAIEVVRLLE